jgi:hypothetical protein
MTTVTKDLAKNLPNNFEFPGITPGFEPCDFDGAVLFRACPTNHPNYASAKRKFNDDLVLTTFTFYFDAHLRYIPHSLINFVTREAIGMVWNMLLNVAEQVRDGTRTKHCHVIAQKQEFYQWVEERCQFMLQTMKDTNDPANESNDLHLNGHHDMDFTRGVAKSSPNEESEEKKGEMTWTLQDILRLNS